MQLNNVPEYLKARPQWVLWKTVSRRGDKPTKLPWQVNGKKMAKSNDPNTWATFDEAVAAYHKGGFSGIGFMFADDDGLTGIDLDGCRNPENGQLAEWAKDIASKLNSYCEISPSGTGIKLFIIGKTPWKSGKKVELKVDPVCEKTPGLEVYERLRYFAVTGRRLKALPEEPAEGQQAIDELCERFWPSEPAKTSTADSRPAELPVDSISDRARKYVDKMPPAISGQDGHNQTFRVACVLAQGFDLPRGQALPILLEYNQRCEPPWSDYDIEHKLDGAYDAGGERGYLLTSDGGDQSVRLPKWEGDTQEVKTVPVADSICNGIEAPGEGETVLPLPIEEIVEQCHRVTGGWPKAVSGSLFYHDGDYTMLGDYEALFGYLYSRGPIRWHRGVGLLAKGEFYKQLPKHVEQYKALEALPHFPSIAGHYYPDAPPLPGDGEALRKLLLLFEPETLVDGDLLKAALLTTFWGGIPGSRPAFMFTGKGRGTGKSKAAEAVANVAGGYFDFTKGDSSDAIKKRLLTAGAIAKRCCLLDNIKAARFSWAEFEALVTCQKISGHRMYAGERERPNTLTWLLTLNAPSLSRDIAQRIIPIRFKVARRSTTWEKRLNDHIGGNREAIIADIAACFAEPPKQIEPATRWANWEGEILARLAEPAEAQKVIVERQRAFDADIEEASEFEDFVARKLDDFGYLGGERVHIPSTMAAQWWNEAMGERLTTQKAARALQQAIEEGLIETVEKNPSRKYGRGFVWNGPTSNPGDGVKYDIESKGKHWHHEW